MRAGDVYNVRFEYKGTFEKKNAVGISSKKHVTLTGLRFGVADKEGATPSTQFDLGQVIQAENTDPLYITFKRDEKDSGIVLKGDRETVDAWYEVARTALEFAGKVKPRNPGLPPIDPRFGLKFVDIPVEFRHRFASLATAVLYWFQPVKKYGSVSKLSGKHKLEERVVIVGDTAMYVTKQSSQITRCMKFSMMKGLFTNVATKREDEEAFVVVKMEAPDYDLYFSSSDLENFCTIVAKLYRATSKGIELPVKEVSTPSDMQVELSVSRPNNFEQAMVVPTTRGPLKKALDVFAAKHGLQLTTTGRTRKTSVGAESGGSGGMGSGVFASNSPTASAATAPAATTSTHDPLPRFLAAVGLSGLGKTLKKHHVDFEVLRVLEGDDYENFGISSADAVKIKAGLDDEQLMAQLLAEENKPSLGSSAGQQGSNTTPATRPATTQAVAPTTKKPINLDSDDDDDFDVPVPPAKVQKPLHTNPTTTKPMSFDDLDDMALNISMNKSFAGRVVLDDSDDDDFADIDTAQKPKTAAVPLDIDDDDI